VLMPVFKDEALGIGYLNAEDTVVFPAKVTV
jgi:hypothetical protein